MTPERNEHKTRQHAHTHTNQKTPKKESDLFLPLEPVLFLLHLLLQALQLMHLMFTAQPSSSQNYANTTLKREPHRLWGEMKTGGDVRGIFGKKSEERKHAKEQSLENYRIREP